MNELFVSLVSLSAAAFWTYRTACQLLYERRVRQEQRERTRGLRLVVRNHNPGLRIHVRFPERG